jgi:hypothetical protein
MGQHLLEMLQYVQNHEVAVGGLVQRIVLLEKVSLLSLDLWIPPMCIFFKDLEGKSANACVHDIVRLIVYHLFN